MVLKTPAVALASIVLPGTDPDVLRTSTVTVPGVPPLAVASKTSTLISLPFVPAVNVCACQVLPLILCAKRNPESKVLDWSSDVIGVRASLTSPGLEAKSTLSLAVPARKSDCDVSVRQPLLGEGATPMLIVDVEPAETTRPVALQPLQYPPAERIMSYVPAGRFVNW